MFRELVEKLLKDTFHTGNMSGLRNVIYKTNTCVIALVIFYKNIAKNPTKVFRVLSSVLYYVIENHVCIDYICCQPKTLRVVCCDKMFASMSYN